jgi:hypothetical protein
VCGCGREYPKGQAVTGPAQQGPVDPGAYQIGPGRWLVREELPARTASAMDRLGAAAGFVCSEGVVGTNSIGGALRTGSASVVCGVEHFADALTGVSCASGATFAGECGLKLADDQAVSWCATSTVRRLQAWFSLMLACRAHSARCVSSNLVWWAGSAACYDGPSPAPFQPNSRVDLRCLTQSGLRRPNHARLDESPARLPEKGQRRPEPAGIPERLLIDMSHGTERGHLF